MKFFFGGIIGIQMGVFLEKYGYRAMYAAGNHVEARVSSIIRNGEWYWPAACSDQLVQIQSRLLEIPVGESNQPIWNSKKGLYSCAETWEFLRKKKNL